MSVTHLPQIRVTDYNSCREFLAAYHAAVKKKNPRWSLSAWAKKLGLPTGSSLAKILSGKRAIGPRLCEKLIEYFTFSEREAKYFKALIQLEKEGATPELTTLVLDELRQGREYPTEEVTERTLAFYSRWFYPAISEMVKARDFAEDPEWIAKNFRLEIPPAEISRCIEVLLSTGILTRDAKGRLATSHWVAAPPDSPELLQQVRRHYGELLELARESIPRTEKEEKVFSWDCFWMKRESLPRAKELIHKFRDRFAKLLEAEDGDELIQFQLQFFPLTRARSDDS